MKLKIPLHTPQNIAKSRAAGQYAAEVLAVVKEHVQPGITTDELDRICFEHITKVQKTIPANIGYHGFPKTVCASVNEVVCHGIPGNRVLADGDIVNIDVAIIKDGWYGDTSRMFCAGHIDPKTQRLIDTTYEAMWAGIKTVSPKATLGDVGHAIQKVAERDGYTVVKEYCGHGIGQVYHDEPEVEHYGRPGRGLPLKEGMIFTIEPMLNAGRAGTKTLKDGWTVVTADNSLSAQWEHMVAVTDNGFEVLTLWPDSDPRYPVP